MTPAVRMIWEATVPSHGHTHSLFGKMDEPTGKYYMRERHAEDYGFEREVDEALQCLLPRHYDEM